MKILNKISNYYRTCDLHFAVYSPIALGFFIILVGAFIGDKMPNGKLPIQLTYFLLATSAAISGFSGIVQIIRKEAPWLPSKPMKGIVPVILGYIWVAFCWGGAVFEVCGLLLLYLG